jgi:hypothetical protein
LTVLRETNSRLAISGNVRWVARYRSSRSSAPVRLIAHSPADPELAATRSRSSRASPTREPAELEHALGLRENRAGGARLRECEVGTCELEADADTGRHLGNLPQALSHLALIEAAGRIILADASRSPSAPTAICSPIIRSA